VVEFQPTKLSEIKLKIFAMKSTFKNKIACSRI